MNSAVAGTALASALDEPDKPFYTDSSLNSLKPMAEFKVASQSMPREKREELVRICNEPATSGGRLEEFCAGREYPPQHMPILDQALEGWRAFARHLTFCAMS